MKLQGDENHIISQRQPNFLANQIAIIKTGNNIIFLN